jgi:hypothetical protein
MNDAQTKALELIKQPDAALLAMDTAARQALHAKLSSTLATRPAPPGSPPAVAAAVPVVLALAGPSKVAAVQAGKVPLLVAAQYSGQRGWEVEWGSNLLLVAANLATGQVTVGIGEHLDKMMPPPPSQEAPAPNARQAAARLVALEQRDLVAVAGDLRGPARYAVTALYHDWKSNTALVDVAGADGAKPPAPRPLDTSHARAVAVEAIKPDTAVGVMVSAPSQGAPGAALPVRVIVKLPLGAAGLQPAQPGQVPSVMPVTALLVQRDRYEVPKIELAAQATVTGSDAHSRMALALFEFDLRATSEDPLPPGHYLLYVVAGGVLSNPRPITLR